MKKALRISLLILILFLCAVWSPWNYLNVSPLILLGIQPPPEVGGLSVTSLAGELEIFVDGELIDTVTPEDSPLQIPTIEPGEHLLKLQRRSLIDDAYWALEKVITFESGVDVIAAYELGPTVEFSEGHFVYATKSASPSDKLILEIKSSTADVDIYLDGVSLGNVPIVDYEVDIDTQFKLKAAKAGYETQEFSILPNEQKDRDKLKGFVLNVFIDMFKQPLPV